MNTSFLWMIFILGILLTVGGLYIMSQSPMYGESAMNGEKFVYGYSPDGFWFLSLPGIVLVSVALWKAYKQNEIKLNV